MRIGIGYDIHRLEEGRPLIIGGAEIPYGKGLKGHSDGDVLLHAVCDAILGALGEDDIGSRFPDDDPAFEGIASVKLLEDVAGIMAGKGFKIKNVDCIVIAEEPKLGPYSGAIKKTIAGILQVPAGDVGFKAKTRERMGDIGRGDAIAAQVVVLLKEE